MPWEAKPWTPLAQWSWALYDLNHDYSQSRDVAAQNPALLADMRQGFNSAMHENDFGLLDMPIGPRTRDGLRPY
ncbi:hypothetical protein FHW96_001261 [Novosphingobium sp. SG751A]|nr:hypothetical protein [Novosphingobium sp. SG751A]